MFEHLNSFFICVLCVRSPVCKAAAITSTVMLFRSAVRHAGRLGQWLNDAVLGWAQLAVDYVLAYTIAFIGIYGFDFSEGGTITRRKCDIRGIMAGGGGGNKPFGAACKDLRSSGRGC